LRRNVLIAICLVLIVIVSTVTVVWMAPWRSSQDAVVLKPYGSLSNAVQGLLRGEVDLLPIDQFDPQTLKPIQNSTQVKLVSIPSFDSTYIGLNLRNWPLREPDFRKAMLYAFNQSEVLNKVLGGLGETLRPGLFSSAYSASGWKTYAQDPYGYNTAKAKRVLDTDGFNEIPGGAFRADPFSGQPLRTMFIISRLSEPYEVAAADLFAKDMQSIGLPIISLPMSDLDFNQALRTYIFDLFIDSTVGNGAPTWLYPMFDSRNDISPVPLGTNVVGYDNSTFDDYVNKLMSASDEVQIQNATEMCQEILTHDLPVLPVFSKNILVAASSRLNVITIAGSVEETVRKTAVNLTRDSKFSRPLRIGFASDFLNLDPASSSNTADWIALRLLTEPLLTFDQNGKLQPDLAQWTQSYRTLTLTISPDARFYTGQNVTANDVATTLNWLIRNARPSSSIYSIVSKVAKVDLIDRRTLRISLSFPDNFAIYRLTDLFALPASRLTSNPSTTSFLLSQLLVSSGPFVLREFTQTDGVYMQLNSQYFRQPVQNMQNFDAFESGGVFSGSQVEVSSSQLVISGQPVSNASYVACVYDQGGVLTQCSTGSYVGQGSYSAGWQIDSRFHSGTYRVESTLYWTLPTGTFVIFKEETMTVHPLPILDVLIFAAIILGFAVVLERRQLEARLRVMIKGRTSKRAHRRRRTR